MDNNTFDFPELLPNYKAALLAALPLAYDLADETDTLAVEVFASSVLDKLCSGKTAFTDNELVTIANAVTFARMFLDGSNMEAFWHLTSEEQNDLRKNAFNYDKLYLLIEKRLKEFEL